MEYVTLTVIYVILSVIDPQRHNKTVNICTYRAAIRPLGADFYRCGHSIECLIKVMYIHRETDGERDRQTDGRTDKQTDRPTDRQTDRQTDRLIEREK